MHAPSFLHEYTALVERFFIPLVVIFGVLLLSFLASLIKLRIVRTLLLSVPLAISAITLAPYILIKYRLGDGLSVERLLGGTPAPLAPGGDAPGTWKYADESGATVTLKLNEDGTFLQTVQPHTGPQKVESGAWRIQEGQLEFNRLLLRDFNRWKSDPVTFKLTGKPKTAGFGIVGGLDKDPATWQPLTRER